MNIPRNFAICLLAAATVLPALASPVNYEITFDVSASLVSGFPSPSGSFTYDPSVGFSNFIVDWGDATFDLTASANAPALAVDPATGCSSGGSNYQYGFLLITQSATGCAAGYVWDGEYHGAVGDGTQGFAEFFFILGVDAAQDEIAAADSFPADLSTPYNDADGTWTVTAESSPTPEPGTISLMSIGTLAVTAMRTFRRR
ncbi:MAG: hypothetical protein WBL61_03820 [Bryobacteraceae bacterium]